MSHSDRPPIAATITGPCWASRLGRYGFAELEDGRRVELCSLDETHRSGRRLMVRQDERGRWGPAVGEPAAAEEGGLQSPLHHEPPCGGPRSPSPSRRCAAGGGS